MSKAWSRRQFQNLKTQAVRTQRKNLISSKFSSKFGRTWILAKSMRLALSLTTLTNLKNQKTLTFPTKDSILSAQSNFIRPSTQLCSCTWNTKWYWRRTWKTSTCILRSPFIASTPLTKRKLKNYTLKSTSMWSISSFLLRIKLRPRKLMEKFWSILLTKIYSGRLTSASKSLTIAWIWQGITSHRYKEVSRINNGMLANRTMSKASASKRKLTREICWSKLTQRFLSKR